MTLLPLVIPAIVIVFGYIRLYNTSSWLPLTGSAFGTDILLMFGYATLALLHVTRGRHRPSHHRHRHADGSGQSLGAGWFTIISKIILPNVLVAVLSGLS